MTEFSSVPGVSIVSAHNPMPTPLLNEVRWDPIPRIWGWATWQSIWKDYRESNEIDLENSQVKKQFLGKIPSTTVRLQFNQMVSGETPKRNWAIGFAAKQILEGRLAVSANVNLVMNAGFDSRGSNTHDWGEIELPKTQPVSSYVRLTQPSVKRFQFVCEDSRRLSRWLFAAILKPRAALHKFGSIIKPSPKIKSVKVD